PLPVHTHGRTRHLHSFPTRRSSDLIYELGYEQELQSIKEELPRETDPFRPGKEERHRLTHVKWHFKAAAQLADRLFKERGCLEVDRKSTGLNSSHEWISYAVFCLKK